jgi:glycosyltransferase involved in cell wall biosynthesis
MMAGTAIVMIAGRDPRDEVSGGHSSYVRSYARAAIMAGFVPHLFCVRRDASTSETEIGIIHCVASPYRPFRQMLAAAHARPLAAAVVRFAAGSHGSLLIHSFGVWGVAGVCAVPSLQRQGIEPVLVQSSYTTYRDEALSHVRGAGTYSLSARIRFAALSWWVALAVERWERRAYLGSRVILVNYDSVGRLIRKRHGLEARLRLMPYAAESAFFDHAPAPKALGRPLIVPLIVAISRHEPRKGVDVLLHALARLKADGVPFQARLAGGGPLLAEHRALALRLLLDDCVSIEGVVPDVRSLLDDADVFVLPSREEQSGSLALLEALQAGAAVVASSVDGILEDLIDGKDALLTRPDDPAHLAAALARVLTDEPLRRRLQVHARATFNERFSAAPFSAALGSVYRELLAEAESRFLAARLGAAPRDAAAR